MADTGGAWFLLSFSSGLAAWHLGFLALPLLHFYAGVCCISLLHGGYLALLIAHFLRSGLQLQPTSAMAAIPFAQVFCAV